MKECRHRVRTGQIDRTRARRSRYNQTVWFLGGERK